ncbi:hypothetical protein EJB05_04993, partial [Eragrostis curvula]
MLVPCAAGVAASAGRPADDSHVEHREAIAQSMSAAPKFEADQAAKDFATESASGESLIGRFVQTIARCKFVAMRSCPELEPDAFPLLTRLYGKPAVPLGLLPPQPDGTRGVSKNTEDDTTMRNDLDGSFDRDGVAGAVRAVAVAEEGRVFASNTRKLQEIVADRECHERCIDGFIQHLRSCAQ